MAGHARCGAHLLALDRAAGAARDADKAAIAPKILAGHEYWFRKVPAAGIMLNSGRSGKLQQKRHPLATRMQAREDDYLRFARDLRVPFTSNEAERTIRMSKLRIKISGYMRSMTGAQELSSPGSTDVTIPPDTSSPSAQSS